MHIADGFLTAPVAAGTAVLAAGGIALAARGVAKEKQGQVVGIGMMAAFLFVAQMVNFPVLPGVTGHLLGAGLAVATLGLAPGMLAMTVVVIAQALFFGDGGIAALGANLLTMAVAGPLVAWGVLGLAGRRGWWSVCLASAAGMFASAGFCALALAFSGCLPLGTAPMFMGIHALIAVFEGVITAAVVLAMAKHGAKEMAPAEAMSRGWRVLAGVTVAVLLVAPLASSWPDGLEYVVEHLGFEEMERPLAWTEGLWFADYQWFGNEETPFYLTWVIGIGGALLAFGAAFGLTRGLRKTVNS